ncbi:MAG TPA: GNAT family N-acetyltransferase [Anaerolineae bacterium]|nr:GNAT family N-acetyltransferase [Anaerolineae bacterium]
MSILAQNVSITMVRRHLHDLPGLILPAPYRLRGYRPGDEQAWYDLHLTADHYNLITPELFQQQFGDDAQFLADRQFYLVAESDQAIGTGTAWLGQREPWLGWGRVHWLAITPEYQGRKLSEPLLAAVLQRLRDLKYTQVYLTTSSARLPAINLYLKFGFEPYILGQGDLKTWLKIGRIIGLSFRPETKTE